MANRDGVVRDMRVSNMLTEFYTAVCMEKCQQVPCAGYLPFPLQVLPALCLRS